MNKNADCWPTGDNFAAFFAPDNVALPEDVGAAPNAPAPKAWDKGAGKSAPHGNLPAKA